MELNNDHIKAFAIESNIISGIDNDQAHEIHAKALTELLSTNKLTINSVQLFIQTIEPTSELRTGDKEVVIGGIRLPNSAQSQMRLLFLLKRINNVEGQHPWFTHYGIMELHAFTEGNARLARAAWLWNMFHKNNFKMEEPFSVVFYNQTFVRYLGFNKAINGE